MFIRTFFVSCLMLAVMSPLAEAKSHRSHIPKSAKYKHNTGAKHFKYKSPKKQKLPKHR